MLGIGLMLAAAPVSAEQVIVARADIDGDGQDEAVELRPTSDGDHRLVVDGRETEAVAGGSTLRIEGSELRPFDLGNGHRAALFRAPLEREGLAFEAILFVRGQEISVVWSGITGLRGDRGSRWGDRVIVEDLTGDGRLNILVASVADEVPLCGVGEPELFPRALDQASGRLRPVMLNRLRGLEVDETTLPASRESPGPLAERPSINVATWAAASTLSGDGGMVEGLAPPRALADGDPSTSWIEGRPGTGSGEFVTARLLPGPYRIQALALTLAPSGDLEGAHSLGRPRTLTLLLDGPEGVRRFGIEVAEDPSTHPGEPVWVNLPEPLRADCLSLVLGEVHGGRRPPTSTAIAEVEIFTDLDFEGGIDRLIEAFTNEEANAEVLLRALGVRALPILRARWDDLDPSVQRRTARVMADLRDPAAADLLANAASSDDQRSAQEARRGLLELADQALEALSACLHADLAAQRAVAADILGEIGTEAALTLLIEQVGEAPVEDHVALRGALTAALGRVGTPGRQMVLERAEAAEGPARLTLMRSLIPVEADERDRFARLVVALWESAESFESRYQVISLAAGCGPVESIRALAGQVLRQSDDRYLRAHAAEALGSMGAHPSTLSHLSQAAQDEWTGVRFATARALGRAAPEQGRATLIRLLTQDAWPAVRAASAESLAHGPNEGAVAPLIQALGDTSPLVQITAARLLGDLGNAEALLPLRTLAENDRAEVEARQTAARAMGTLCSIQAQAALVALVQRGRERRTTPDRARVAAAAVGSLAGFRGDDVDALLAQVAREGIPGLRLAAIEALGRRGGAVAREVLESLDEDPIAPIRVAAADALRQLEDQPVEPRCPR
jgi:HEAT repeat protein